MNLYLLQFVGKWVGMICISILSFFGGVTVQEENYNVPNLNANKGENVVSKVIQYDTKIEYNRSLPSDTRNVLTKGVDGLSYIDEDGNEEIINEMISEVVEVGTGPKANYVGKITGYGPDCPGCSAVGNVACRTREGKNHSLVNDSIYYTDTEYGKIHILAADRSLFPCGTILEVKKGETSFIGVVLDTGGAMRSAWKQGVVLIDLAYESQKAALQEQIIHGNNVNYTVKRWGW